jgi:Tfp pilus assembly protein PilN
MIKINLIEQKKKFSLPVVLGIDLNKLNFKMLLIVFILNFALDYFVVSSWTEGVNVIKLSIKADDKKLKALNTDLKKNSQVKKQLEAFNKERERLEQREVQVRKIIEQKANPKDLLLRVARSIPEDLWITLFSINSLQEVQITGQSQSYKSIGDFIIAANESTFFGRSLRLKKADTKASLNGKRTEQFEIIGTVKSY